MTEPKNSFFAITRGQLACIPVLIGWPIVTYYFLREEAFILSLLVYFLVGCATRCLWPCMLTFLGAMVGLAFDPIVKGGSIESQMWETVNHFAFGAIVGLFLGFLIKDLRYAKQTRLAQEGKEEPHYPWHISKRNQTIS